MSFKGDLSTIGLAEVFQMISMSQKEGTLIVEDGESKKSIYFGPTGVKLVSTGSRKGLRLGDILLRTGKVTEGQLSEALENSKIMKRMLGEVLVESGLVSDAEIQQSVREQIEEEIYDLFLWKKANFEFVEGPDSGAARDADAPVTRLSFDVNGLLLEAVRRADEWNVINQKVPSLDSIYVFVSEADRTEEDGVAPDSLKRVYRLLDGSTSIAEIVEATGVSKFESCRSLVDLQERGRIRLLGVQETLDVASRRMGEGQKEKSLRLFRAAVAQAPDDPKVLAAVARVFEGEGLVKESAATYVKVGRAFLQRGELDRALDYTQQASRMSPDDLDIRFSMFEIHAAAGNLEEGKKLGRELVQHCLMVPDHARARTLCERIISADRGDVDFHVLRAKVLHRTSQKRDLEEELGWIRQNMPVDPRRVEAIQKDLQEMLVRAPTRSPSRIMRPGPRRKGRPVLVLVVLLLLGGLGYAGWYEFDSSRKADAAVAEARGLLERQEYVEARRRIDAFVASTFSPTQKKKAEEFHKQIEASQKNAEEERRRREERERTAARDRMRSMEARIEEIRTSNPHVALREAEELRDFAVRAQDADTIRRAEELVEALRTYIKRAHDLAEKAANFEKEGKPREAALAVDELLANYGNTEPARGALYPLWITTRPDRVRVTSVGTGFEIGVTDAGAPLRHRMKSGESVRLRFERAGYRSLERPISNKTAGRLHVDLLEKQEAWVNTLGVTVTSEPVLAEDVLYLASSGRLYALRVRPKFQFGWVQPVEGNIEGRSCAGGKDRVFVATNARLLYAMDPTAAEGKRIAWKYDARERVSGPPGLSPDGSLVLVGTADRTLHAVDARTGELKWKRELPGEARVEPVAAGGAVVVACDDGTMMAIRGPAAGDEVWRWKANGGFGPMSVAEGMIYSAAADQALYAVDAATGKRSWSRVMPVPVTGRVGRSLGGLYAAGRDGRLYVLDAATGDPLQGYPMGGPAPGGLVAAGPWILYGSEDQLQTFDAAARQPGWTFKVPTQKMIRFAPAVGGGFAYFVSDENIYAIELN